MPLISSGTNQDPTTQDIVIANPFDMTRTPPGRIGEIWMSSLSTAKGYWREPDKDRELFRAYLKDGTGPYMRSGDLGFLFEGHLFITGRQKDMIIIRGKNVYPQDVEVVVEGAHPAIRPGCVCVVGLDIDDEEQLAVVTEIRAGLTDYEGAARALINAVSTQNELKVYVVALIEQGSLYKTSSGKIQHSANRQELMNPEPFGNQLLYYWHAKTGGILTDAGRDSQKRNPPAVATAPAAPAPAPVTTPATPAAPAATPTSAGAPKNKKDRPPRAPVEPHPDPDALTRQDIEDWLRQDVCMFICMTFCSLGGVLHVYVTHTPIANRSPQLASNVRLPSPIASPSPAQIAAALGLDASELALSEPLSRYGIDSQGAAELAGDLETWLGREVPATLAYTYPTIEALARHLHAVRPSPPPALASSFFLPCIVLSWYF